MGGLKILNGVFWSVPQDNGTLFLAIKGNPKVQGINNISMGDKNSKPQVPKGWVAVWDDKYNGKSKLRIE